MHAYVRVKMTDDRGPVISSVRRGSVWPDAPRGRPTRERAREMTNVRP